MFYFFTDLDNTIIFSHHHDIGDTKICIEVLDGKDQGFITYKTLNYLENQTWLDVVPVTMRSYNQYNRLEALLNQIGCKKSLVCSGAVLVSDGKIDKDWENESLLISIEARKSLDGLYRSICSLFGNDKIVFEYPYMFYLKSTDVCTDIQTIKYYLEYEYIDVFCDARKIYFIPKCFSKGNSLKRYLKRFGKGFSIAAGDSQADISLLKQADIGYYPESSKDLFIDNINAISVKPIFSDSICCELQKLHQEVILK